MNVPLMLGPVRVTARLLFMRGGGERGASQLRMQDLVDRKVAPWLEAGVRDAIPSANQPRPATRAAEDRRSDPECLPPLGCLAEEQDSIYVVASASDSEADRGDH